MHLLVNPDGSVDGSPVTHSWFRRLPHLDVLLTSLGLPGVVARACPAPRDPAPARHRQAAVPGALGSLSSATRPYTWSSRHLSVGYPASPDCWHPSAAPVLQSPQPSARPRLPYVQAQGTTGPGPPRGRPAAHFPTPVGAPGFLASEACHGAAAWARLHNALPAPDPDGQNLKPAGSRPRISISAILPSPSWNRRSALLLTLSPIPSSGFSPSLPLEITFSTSASGKKSLVVPPTDFPTAATQLPGSCAAEDQTCSDTKCHNPYFRPCMFQP